MLRLIVLCLIRTLDNRNPLFVTGVRANVHVGTYYFFGSSFFSSGFGSGNLNCSQMSTIVSLKYHSSLTR